MKFNPQETLHNKKYIKHYRQGLLVDTYPLLLYFIGEFDEKNGTNFVEKLQNKSNYYTKQDYLFLKQFIQVIQFKKLLITPHIFHEFYKHASTVLDKQQFYAFFDYNKDMLELLNEESIHKNKLMSHPYFKKLEIGELSLYMLKEDETFCAILTDDERKTLPLFEGDKKVLLILVNDAISHMMNGPIPNQKL